MQEVLDSLLGRFGSSALPADDKIRLCAAILDATLEHVYVCGPDGRLLYASPAAARYTGFTQAQMVGLTGYDLGFSASTVEFIHDARARVLETGASISRDSMEIRDGDTRYYHYTIAPLPPCGDGIPDAVIVIAAEVTQTVDTLTAQSESQISHHVSAQERLRDSEQFLRKTLDSISAFVGVIATDGTLIEANQAALAVGGTSREEVVGLKLWDTPYFSYSPEAMELIRRNIERAAAGEIVRFDAIGQIRGPAFINVDIAISPMLDDTGAVERLVASGTDITERKVIEEALRLSEQRLRLALEGASLGTWHLNLVTGRAEFSARCREILELDLSADLTIETAFAKVHPEDQPRRSAAVQAAVDDQGSYEVEYRIVKPDGGVRWILSRGRVYTDDNGNAVTIEGIAQDINERKRTEFALRDSEQRMRLALDAAKMGTWLVEFASDHVWQSGHVGAMFGYELEERAISLAEFRQHIFIEDLPQQISAFEYAKTTCEPYVAEYRVIGGDGVLRWVSARGQAFLNRVGEPVRMIGVAVDITERKEAEQELAEALEREHNIAATLQRSLLQMPPSDAFDGIAVSTLYESATQDLEIGGDFMDAFALSDGRIALVVGDVSGKGLPAAAQTAEIKYSLRAFMSEYGSAAKAMDKLNVFLTRDRITDSRSEIGFVCLSLAIVDAKNDSVEFSIAGSEPPLIIRANGAADEAAVKGLPLGVVETAAYSTLSLPFSDGDMLVLVTDGITESRIGGRMFGYEGLKRVASQTRSLSSLRQISHMLFESARTFAEGRLSDDACLLVARRTG